MEEVSSGPKTEVALADTVAAKHEGEVSSGPEGAKHERLHELAQLAISESEVAQLEISRTRSGSASLGQLASPQSRAQSPAHSPERDRAQPAGASGGGAAGGVSPDADAGAEEEGGEEDMHQMAIEELRRRHDAEVATPSFEAEPYFLPEPGP